MLFDLAHHPPKGPPATVGVIGAEQSHYITPPMRIGRTWWRCVVFSHATYGRCTEYQWIRDDPSGFYHGDCWRAGNQWPSYERNHNNSNGGLPAGLSRLYARYRQQIQAALEGGAQ